MKNCSFELEFKTHMLAVGDGPNGEPDHFQRDSNNEIVLQQSAWHSAFTRSIDLARLRGLKATDIQVDLSFTAPTQVYNRRYGDHKARPHEAVMPGTKVRFEGIVADSVTTDILTTLLTAMGRFVGMSPYGYRLGFGKFNVIHVSVDPSDAAS